MKSLLVVIALVTLAGVYCSDSDEILTGFSQIKDKVQSGLHDKATQFQDQVHRFRDNVKDNLRGHVQHMQQHFGVQPVGDHYAQQQYQQQGQQGYRPMSQDGKYMNWDSNDQSEVQQQQYAQQLQNQAWGVSGQQGEHQVGQYPFGQNHHAHIPGQNQQSLFQQRQNQQDSHQQEQYLQGQYQARQYGQQGKYPYGQGQQGQVYNQHGQYQQPNYGEEENPLENRYGYFQQKLSGAQDYNEQGQQQQNYPKRIYGQQNKQRVYHPDEQEGGRYVVNQQRSRASEDSSEESNEGVYRKSSYGAL